MLLLGRVLEAVAAYCGLETGELESTVAAAWPRAAWSALVQDAFRHALDQGRYWTDERDEASALMDRVFTDRRPTGQYLAQLKVAAEHRDELVRWLATCEHRREAVRIDALVDAGVLLDLFAGYEAEAEVLGRRRRRVRNAITHGNPVSEVALRSVLPFARWMAEVALRRGVDVYTSGRPYRSITSTKDADVAKEEARLRAGESLLDIWREPTRGLGGGEPGR